MPKNRRAADDNDIDNDNDDHHRSRRKSTPSNRGPSSTRRQNDNDADAAHLQGHTSTGTGAIAELVASIPRDEMNAYISGAVKVALAASHRNTSFRKKDIADQVLKDKDRAKAVNHVFEEMKKRLKDVFAFEVKEYAVIEKPKTIDAERRALAKSMARGKQTSKHSGQYTLVHTLGTYHQAAVHDEREMDIQEPHENTKEVGLLAVILALIMVSGRTIDDKTLETHLRSLGIRPRQQHTDFGNLADFLKEQCHLKYLVKSVTASADGDITEYQWGPKAKAEWPDKNIIKFITEIFGVRDDAARKHLEIVVKAAAETEVPELD